MAWSERKAIRIRIVGVLALCLLATAFQGSARADMVDPAHTLRLGNGALSPLTRDDGNGLIDIILREAFATLGYAVETEALPSSRSLSLANAGRLDGDMVRIAELGSEMPNLVRVEEPLIPYDLVLYAPDRFRSSLPPDRSLDGYCVGIIRGRRLMERNVHTSCLVRAADYTELFSLLAKGRLDFVAGNRLEAYAALQEHPPGIVVREVARLLTTTGHLYLHKRHAALAEALSRVLRAMKRDGRYDRLVKQAWHQTFGTESESLWPPR